MICREAGDGGAAMARARSLTQFLGEFSDETACAAFLSERRWPGGFACPSCGSVRDAALKSRAYTYECLDCGRQTSLTAGTVMHRSKLPLTVWFWAAHLMSTHSNGMSARQLEDQLGVTYMTALAADAEIAPLDGRSGTRFVGGRRRGRSGGNSVPRGRCLLRA